MPRALAQAWLRCCACLWASHGSCMMTDMHAQATARREGSGHLRRLGWVLFAELHGEGEVAALPVRVALSRDEAVPPHQVDRPARAPVETSHNRWHLANAPARLCCFARGATPARIFEACSRPTQGGGQAAADVVGQCSLPVKGETVRQTPEILGIGAHPSAAVSGRAWKPKGLSNDVQCISSGHLRAQMSIQIMC